MAVGCTSCSSRRCVQGSPPALCQAPGRWLVQLLMLYRMVREVCAVRVPNLVQVTGQEVMRVPGSSHVACTVEMANLGNQVDVAIIDEIQVRLLVYAAQPGAC